MDYKQMIMSIKTSCQVTLKCNNRIMEREFERTIYYPRNWKTSSTAYASCNK